MSWTLYERARQVAPWVPHAGGRYYANHHEAGTTTVAVSANTLYAVPFFVPVKATYTIIGVEVTSFATGNVRFGIWRDNTGVPGALVLDCGTASTGTSNGFKQAAISQELEAGWYWIGGVFDATPTCRATTASSCLRGLGFTSGTSTSPASGWQVAFTYAALADPFTAGGALSTSNFPRFMVSL